MQGISRKCHIRHVTMYLHYGETNDIGLGLVEFVCRKELTLANTLYPPKINMPPKNNVAFLFSSAVRGRATPLVRFLQVIQYDSLISSTSQINDTDGKLHNDVLESCKILQGSFFYEINSNAAFTARRPAKCGGRCTVPPWRGQRQCTPWQCGSHWALMAFQQGC